MAWSRTMPRFALKIEYDGAPFNGWQRQAQGQPSVQAAVEAALAKLEPGPHTIAAAGRTDTGVHGRGQVAHIDLIKPWDPFRLSQALNQHLRPLPVAVLACAQVPDDFHARFSALERRYLYRILTRRAPPVLDAGQVWHLLTPLDLAAMQQGAAHLVGHHDFTTFRSALCQANSPIKTLDNHRPSRAPWHRIPLCPAGAVVFAQSGPLNGGHLGARGKWRLGARTGGSGTGRTRPRRLWQRGPAARAVLDRGALSG